MEVTAIKRTISAMSGDGVVAHNRRTYIAENVDATRTHLNVEYCYMPIEDAYHQLFDEAQAEYNAKQKRKDRRVENYYEKICNGDQEKPFYEVIFQVGNKDDMGAAGANGELAKAILDKFYHSFLERNPQLHVYSAHLHMDEATPHLHIDFIPFTTGSKRGLSTHVSLKQALADQGITGEGRSLTERDLWVQKRKKHSQRLCWSMVSSGSRKANTRNISAFWNLSDRNEKRKLRNWNRPLSVSSRSKFSFKRWSRSKPNPCR